MTPPVDSAQQPKRLKWKSITRRCTKAAEQMGHKLEPFKATSSILRMSGCETCGGCCWVAHSSVRGFVAGGRLLAYRCGTPEAVGVL